MWNKRIKKTSHILENFSCVVTGNGLTAVGTSHISLSACSITSAQVSQSVQAIQVSLAISVLDFNLEFCLSCDHLAYSFLQFPIKKNCHLNMYNTQTFSSINSRSPGPYTRGVYCWRIDQEKNFWWDLNPWPLTPKENVQPQDHTAT